MLQQHAGTIMSGHTHRCKYCGAELHYDGVGWLDPDGRDYCAATGPGRGRFHFPRQIGGMKMERLDTAIENIIVDHMPVGTSIRAGQ
jgi:hypothetical protein